jgi:hypothetical protein
MLEHDSVARKEKRVDIGYWIVSALMVVLCMASLIFFILDLCGSIGRR